jgi:pimeloyl-ACP methyl ester carboxylesterase
MGSASVFGSSSGAVIGLDLAARSPHVVELLVAHEPPVISVLGDADRWFAFFDELDRTLEEEGMPVDPLFCVINGPTHGRPWSTAAARADLHNTAVQAGVRRRFAPHHYADPVVKPALGESPRTVGCWWG